MKLTDRGMDVGPVAPKIVADHLAAIGATELATLTFVATDVVMAWVATDRGILDYSVQKGRLSGKLGNPTKIAAKLIPWSRTWMDLECDGEGDDGGHTTSYTFRLEPASLHLTQDQALAGPQAYTDFVAVVAELATGNITQLG